MITKKKKCEGCNEMQYIWKRVAGKPYCKTCSSKATGVAKSGESKPKVQYRIPARSSKQAKLEAAYTVLRNAYLKKHPSCEAKLPGCSITAGEIHHSKGRGEYLLDDTTFKAVCRTCHMWIETHPIEAKELGLSQSRLEKNDI